jgi:hypothetical protein
MREHYKIKIFTWKQNDDKIFLLKKSVCQVRCPIITGFRSLKQEDHEFKVNLGCIVKPMYK